MSERMGAEIDRIAVPGGWIYRTWFNVLLPGKRIGPGVDVPERTQMQAVFVPNPSAAVTAAASDQAISAAATKPAAGPAPVESSAQPVVAAVITAGEWPKDFARALCEVWVMRWGKGSAPGDVIASAGRVLKKEGAPWDAVFRSFQRYCETVENEYASPMAWRKRWSAYDPEQPEFDAETAKIADSYDRSARARARGGFEPVGNVLKRLK